ncbi:Mariner Mos1 transposase [Acromyrmex echinatior]|uniref:Mariner Mos1 transposase n=2 Tax=Acromyrmex echinatior TaxID=103372 RepID=F4WRJ5_ACREC|nr:Mariner Mos1 transposase [Acromyrmex echinatior]
MEQRAVIKFNAKLGKSASETFRSMQQVYGSQCLDCIAVFEWHKRFLEGRETLEDDKKSGRPISVRTPEMIEKVRDFVANDRNASLKMMEEALNISRETIRTILHEDLGKTKFVRIILLHDNARPHVAKPVKTYLETLKWEVLPHPPYSPDIAPSDYHLFRSLAHSLCEQKFTSYEDCTKWFDSWISSKDEQFFRRGIHSLPERWSKVVESDGKYFH